MKKENFVTALLPILNNTLGSEQCGKRNCQVCQFIVNTDTFNPILLAQIKLLKLMKVHLILTLKCEIPYAGKA